MHTILTKQKKFNEKKKKNH